MNEPDNSREPQNRRGSSSPGGTPGNVRTSPRTSDAGPRRGSASPGRSSGGSRRSSVGGHRKSAEGPTPGSPVNTPEVHPGSPEPSRKSSAGATERAVKTPEGPETSSPGEKKPGSAPSPEERVATVNDALNAEFSYYCAVLRTYAPSLTREYDKAATRLWMRKLFGPEYHPAVLKPKRNKYLLYLSITIYNDETHGIFKQEPPCGKLPEIKDIFFDKEAFPPAAWESEKQWTETIKDLPDELKITECYLHGREGCSSRDDQYAEVLDAEFRFFLWLSKPYVALLPDPEEKTTAACWIRLLCGIAPEKEDCPELKEIRNDYMQTLLGYVHDLRVEGPFRLMPPGGPIPPLALLYEDCKGDKDFADPAGGQAEEFLALQRLPDSGAFAYINVTGELFGDL